MFSKVDTDFSNFEKGGGGGSLFLEFRNSNYNPFMSMSLAVIFYDIQCYSSVLHSFCVNVFSPYM